MSNWIDCFIDVLATSHEDITAIEARLKKPSAELADWVAGRWEQPVAEIMQSLTELVTFESVGNIGHLDSTNKAWRFKNSFKDRYTGIVRSQIRDVSRQFQWAVVMVEYVDLGNYVSREVMHRGETLCTITDGHQRAQVLDWMLLDIFAPFRAEHDLHLAAGSLWNEWVRDLCEASGLLRERFDIRPQFTEDNAPLSAEELKRFPVDQLENS